VAADDIDLLCLHIEAVWSVHVPRLRPGDVEMPACAGATPWALYAAEVGSAEVRVWRDVPEYARAGLRERARRMLGRVGEDPGAGGTGEVVFRRTPPVPVATTPVRRLGGDDRALLEAFEPGETAYWLAPARAPLFGMLERDLLVGVAHSSRRTAQACELGINTLPAARRKGFARACVLAWAEAVAAEHLEPLYSASWTNTASLRLAEECGYRAFARAAQVTRVGT